jgi:hypothetical protein
MAPSAQGCLLHDIARFIRPLPELARQEEGRAADLSECRGELLGLIVLRCRPRVVRLLTNDHPFTC